MNLRFRFTALFVSCIVPAFFACTLRAEITVTVYPQVQAVSAPAGLEFKTEPSLGSRTTQAIKEATVFRAKAYVDTPQGRFYLSEKSFESLRSGRPGYWAFISPGTPAPAVSPALNVTVFPQVQEIQAPSGLQFKTAPDLASRTTQTIAEATVFHAKAYVDVPAGRFFLSARSYEQWQQGKTSYWAYITGISNASAPASTPGPRAPEPYAPDPPEMQQGSQLYEQARFGEAERVFRNVFEQRKAEFGPDSFNLNSSLSSLISTLESQGKLAEMEPLLFQWNRIIEKHLAASSGGHSASLSRIIAFYELIGDNDKSAQWIEKYASHFVESDFEYADNSEYFFKPAVRHHYAVIYVARSYMRIGQFQKAETMLSKALAGITRMVNGGGNYLEIARSAQASTQTAMADLYLATGRNDAALKLLNEAVATMRINAASHPDDNDTAPPSVLVKIGKLRLEQGDTEVAEQMLQEAAAILSRHQTKDAEHDKTSLECASALGAAQLIRGNRAGALEQAERTARLQKKSLSEILSFGSERQRLAFREAQRPYDLFAALQDAHALAEAALQTKGVVLDSICEDQMIAREAGNNRLLASLKTARAELQFLRLKDGSDGFKVTPAMLDRLRDQVEALEGDLARQGRLVSSSRRALKIGVADVCRFLPKDSALVEFIRYGEIMPGGSLQPSYGAVVIPPSGAPSFHPCGSSSAIDAKIAIHRTLAGEPLKPGETLVERDARLEKTSRELYSMLAAPVEKALPPGTQEVILSPDGQLHFLAFSTLLDEQGRFWSEKVTLRNVSTGRDLIKQPAKKAPGQVQDIVLVGDPAYLDDKPARLIAQAPGQTSAASTQNMVAMNLRGGLNHQVRGLNLFPLPGTAAEVKGLESRFLARGWNAKVLSSTTATESALQSIQSPAILHLATHGFFLDELEMGTKQGPDAAISNAGSVTRHAGPLRDPMLCSGLALSGAQSTLNLWSTGRVPPLDQDGILTAAEAASLNLSSTSLVSLSACETGLGEARSGEGVLGLKRGFAVAGAQNLLMTLWQISDDETVALMNAFYDRVLKGEPPSRALPSVQREFLVRLRKDLGLFQAINLAGPFVLVGGTALP